MATGHSGFVIAGLQRGSLALWTSSDGLNWSSVDVAADAFPPDYTIHDLVWTGSEYIALAQAWQNTTDPVVWRSADLETWQPIDLPCPTYPYAGEVATGDGTAMISGSCDGASVVWTSTDLRGFARLPAPSGHEPTLVHTEGWWYASSNSALWRSTDGSSWTAVDLPTPEERQLRLTAQGQTLYLLVGGYPSSDAEVWAKTGEAAWVQVNGPWAIGEDVRSGCTVVTGPAGTIVSWSLGYWPSAHATQSPRCLERGELMVCLCRPGACIDAAVVITDPAGDRLLEVEFPEGESPPGQIEINIKAEEVRFLHPSTGAVLAELTFAEIEDALRLREPEQHTWWSADGSSWTEWGEAHFHSRPRWTAIGNSAVVAVEIAEHSDFPRWVERMLDLPRNWVPEVWVRQTG